jgi:hypothetical protein
MKYRKTLLFCSNFYKNEILICDSDNRFYTNIYKINHPMLGIGKENKNRNPCRGMQKEE